MGDLVPRDLGVEMPRSTGSTEHQHEAQHTIWDTAEYKTKAVLVGERQMISANTKS